MSKIIILRGNSGSGKSTVSKALQRKIGRGTLIVSQDYVRREMLWVQDKPNNQAVDLLENLVLYGHKHCDITILDGILYSDIYDSLFKLIENLFFNNIFAYYFDLSFDETIRRHKQRPQLYEFGEADMKKWWRDKDFLPNISEKMIYKEMTLDEIVEQIYQEIKIN